MQLPPLQRPVIFFDIDDTITSNGKIPTSSYQALWKLSKKNIPAIAVTGRPAGWCDMIAHFFPLHGIIGENGAFAFYSQHSLKRHWFQSQNQGKANQEKILAIFKNEILPRFPETRLANDQFSRSHDVAINIRENKSESLSTTTIQNIRSILENKGATVMESSIHLNIWFGQHNKQTAVLWYIQELFNEKKIQPLFIGDSPNDEPLFAFIPLSFGVANIESSLPLLKNKPRFLCKGYAAEGFCEFVENVIQATTLPN